MKKIILFGAGAVGRKVCDFLQRAELGEVIECFCDNSVELGKEKQIECFKVYNYEECKGKLNEFVITSTKYAEEIKTILQRDQKKYFSSISEWASFYKYDRKPEWNRIFCAWIHLSAMDDYYDEAESDLAMNRFWGNNSLFHRMFRQLDLDNVIELAVGHGRHVRMYEQQARHIMLVDILQENINFCKERFKDSTNIDYYCNNGYNLTRCAS